MVYVHSLRFNPYFYSMVLCVSAKVGINSHCTDVLENVFHLMYVRNYPAAIEQTHAVIGNNLIATRFLLL